MAEKVYEFGFNNQLPRVFEVVNSIISVEPGAASHKTGQPESMPRLAVTHAAATKIRGLWAAAFSDDLVKSLTAIKNQVKKSLDKYGKFMKKGNKSTREKLKSYRLQNSFLRDCFSKNINADYLTKLEHFEVEQKLYADQVGSRIMYLDEEIDEEYEALRSARLKQEAEAEEAFHSEMEHIYGDDCGEKSGFSSPSPADQVRSTRSGCILPENNMVAEGTQTDLHVVVQPPVRKVKVCTDEIKSALAEVSVVAQISPEKARKAAQAFARNFYQHNYYLCPQEKNPSHISKKPRTAEDYAAYHDIFPDAKTIAT